MKPVTQSRVGEDGTCFRACIASILEVPEKRIPDFGASGDDETWWADVQAWLNKAGYTYRRVPIDGTKPVGYSTIEGLSPRGGLHACVAKDGVLVHDPHPQDGTGRGLVEPRYYGLFENTRRASDAKGFEKICAGCGVPLQNKMKVLTCQACRYERAQELSGKPVDKKYAEAMRKELRKSGKASDVKQVETPKAAGEYLRERAAKQSDKNRRLAIQKKSFHKYLTGNKVLARDRSDMLQLRKNTAKQGGPFLIQVTEKNGKEHTVPTRGARL